LRSKWRSAVFAVFRAGPTARTLDDSRAWQEDRFISAKNGENGEKRRTRRDGVKEASRHELRRSRARGYLGSLHDAGMKTGADIEAGWLGGGGGVGDDLAARMSGLTVYRDAV